MARQVDFFQTVIRKGERICEGECEVKSLFSKDEKRYRWNEYASREKHQHKTKKKLLK